MTHALCLRSVVGMWGNAGGETNRKPDGPLSFGRCAWGAAVVFPTVQVVFHDVVKLFGFIQFVGTDLTPHDRAADLVQYDGRPAAYADSRCTA